MPSEDFESWKKKIPLFFILPGVIQTSIYLDYIMPDMFLFVENVLENVFIAVFFCLLGIIFTSMLATIVLSVTVVIFFTVKHFHTNPKKLYIEDEESADLAAQMISLGSEENRRKGDNNDEYESED